MNLEQYYNFQTKVLQTDAESKEDILLAIASSAVTSNTIQGIDTEHLYKKLKEREAVGSTGFGDGIAIPHCTLNNIDSFVIGTLISEKGIDFNSIDGKPVYLFMYIIAPSKKRNEHIRILSEISKVLRVPSQLNTLLKQNNTKDFFATFSKFGNWELLDDLPKEYSQFTVHIQDARAFDKILELFTEIEDSHVSVIDGNNVSKYLYALPLFSHFMNEEHKGFHRLILAVANTVYVNDTLRKIGMIMKDLDCGSKVLVTTHPLNYFNGGIDI
ncbi:MAG: PTS sugar transporter subunit IIA [Candidatus Marinimicrobia bacterium]|nr:PTS sugar transporter subunit IIA [Candidatus Neomarinimicrobiota bacterium]